MVTAAGEGESMYFSVRLHDQARLTGESVKCLGMSPRQLEELAAGGNGVLCTPYRDLFWSSNSHSPDCHQIDRVGHVY